MLHCERDLIFGRVGLTAFPSNLDSAPEAVNSIVIFAALGKDTLSSNHFPSCHWIHSFAARLPSWKHLKEKQEWVMCMSLHVWSVIMILHSRPQRPRSFWSAPRIATSGQVQHRKSAIHGLPVTLRMFRVKFDKSDWFWSQSVVFTEPFQNRMSLDGARGRDSWCWPKGVRPLGTRMMIMWSGFHSEVEPKPYRLVHTRLTSSASASWFCFHFFISSSFNGFSVRVLCDWPDLFLILPLTTLDWKPL